MKLTDDVCFYQELLDQSEGYQHFVEFCNAYLSDVQNLWNKRTEIFQQQEPIIRRQAQSMITGASYSIVTSNPFAAAAYHQHVQNKLDDQQKKAQDYYDRECQKLLYETEKAVKDKLSDEKKQLLSALNQSIDLFCFEMFSQHALTWSRQTIQNELIAKLPPETYQEYQADLKAAYSDIVQSLTPKNYLASNVYFEKENFAKAIELCPYNLKIYTKLVTFYRTVNDSISQLLRQMGLTNYVAGYLKDLVNSLAKEYSVAETYDLTFWSICAIAILENNADNIRNNEFIVEFYDRLAQAMIKAINKLNTELDSITSEPESYKQWVSKIGSNLPEEKVKEAIVKYLNKQIAPQSIDDLEASLNDLNEIGDTSYLTTAQQLFGEDVQNGADLKKKFQDKLDVKADVMLKPKAEVEEQEADQNFRKFIWIMIAIIAGIAFFATR